MANPKSTASIHGHPIHPMLIPFPIAFFVAAFVCDLAFAVTGNTMWSTAAVWLLGAGIVMALAAAAAGFVDFFGDQRIRDLNDVWWHMGGNLAAVAAQVVNWAIRYAWGDEVVLPWGLLLSLIVVGGLLFTGWKGWEMVYKHRVGIAEEGHSTAGATAEMAHRQAEAQRTATGRR